MEEMFMSEGITKSKRMLHTPGTFAKKNLLYVQEVGILESIIPHVCRRENLDSFLIFEVLDGRGTITRGKEVIELHKGDCIWIDCQEPFEHISSEDEPWKLAWIHLNGRCAKEFNKLFIERNQGFVFVTTNHNEIKNTVDKLLTFIRDNASELEMHEVLTKLLVSCMLRNDEKSRIKEIREYINANCTDSELINSLSNRFNVSKLELDRNFCKNYGINLRDYIMNRRFNYAKELLRFTIKPINQVISESGIDNEDLFYQLFRENEEMTPEEYRKNWAQWIKD